MALDFPTSPSLNEVFDRWVWDGDKWVLPGGIGGMESGSNANGKWIKFPDGTMIQSGSFTITTQGSGFVGPDDGDFPVPFVGDIPSMVTNATGGQFWSAVANPTLSSFTMFAQRLNSTTQIPPRAFSWQAIGRWK